MKAYAEAARCDQLSSGRFSLIRGFKYWAEPGWEAEKQHVNQPHYTAVIHLPGAVIHAVFTPYICFCGNISSRGMAWWQTQFFYAPPSSSLSSPLLHSPFSFFHSPSHSLLKRLSHWFAFCCGESGEVAQCVLVKAVPHLPSIIRQLCWKDPSLIPLWSPISRHKEVSGLVFLCKSVFIYSGSDYHDQVSIPWQLRAGKYSANIDWFVLLSRKGHGGILAAVLHWIKTSS